MLCSRNLAAFSTIRLGEEASHCKELQSFGTTPMQLHSGGKFLRLPSSLARMWRYSQKYEPLVYVRSCYSKILELIWEHGETSGTASVVALGTPGIGKSGFVFVLLWELLQKRNCDLILLKFKGSRKFYAFNKSGKMTTLFDSVAAGNLVESYENANVWYLADWMVDDSHCDLPCKTVIATSPDRQNYHQFSKGDDVIRLYIPTWSREEIDVLNDQVFKHPKEEVDERFEKWGGVPRHVLARTSMHQQEELEEAIQGVAMGVQYSGRLYVTPDHSESVYHITVDDEETYAVASKKIATAYIADKLAAGLNVDVLDRVLNYDSATAQYENALYADFFERKFHLLLLNGCSMRSATMDSKALFQLDSARSFFKATALKSMRAEFPLGMTPEELDRTVIMPKDRNNSDWDLIFGRRVIQLTVSNKRRNKGLYPYGKRPGWNEAFEFLRAVYKDGSLELIFAVPLVKLNEFTVTVHEGSSPDAKAKIMRDYANANIVVKKMSCYLGGRDENQLLGLRIEEST